MISEEGTERRGIRRLIWPGLVSLFLHLIVMPAVGWFWLSSFLHEFSKPPPQEQVLMSTAVRIERRPVPRPVNHPVAVTPPQPQVVAHAASQAAAPSHAAPAAPLHELARENPTAPPQPPAEKRVQPAPESMESRLQRQEQQFSQAIASLKAKNAPLSIATTKPQPAAAFHKATFDMSGYHEPKGAEMVMVPLKHWNEGGLSCYYVSYTAELAAGGGEDGTIPWPVCYPPNHDYFLLEIGSRAPIPYPQPGYVLPPGTYLTPLLKRIYEHEQS